MSKTLLQAFFGSQTSGPDRVFRLGWLSSWNTRCGIAEYSKLLLDQFDPRRFAWTVLASKNDSLLVPDSANVIRCWTDHSGSAQALFDVLKAEAFDGLVIQFNFGFLALEDLKAILLYCRSIGTKTLLVFHSTADADIVGQVVSLAQIADGLNAADHILVHAADDVTRLRSFGVVDNVSLFPHGYVDTLAYERTAARVALGLPPDDVIIGSYGFLLPHKGIIQLIEAGALLRAAGVPVKLLLVNALYPIPQSQELLDLCRQIAAERGMQDDVIFESRFLSNEVSIQTLAACDLIVYAYQGTRESSSAAVRMGIAARRPVLCSPLPIFSDVAEVVRFLPGPRPEDIRDGVLAFLSDDTGRQQLSERQDAWLERYSWRRVAQLLQKRLTKTPDAATAPADFLAFLRRAWKLPLRRTRWGGIVFRIGAAIREPRLALRSLGRRCAYWFSPTRQLLLARDAALAERDEAIRSRDMAVQSLLGGAVPSLPPQEAPRFEAPVSQLVSEAQFFSPRFEFWRQAFRMRSGLNRKLWEYLYVANALDHYVGLREGVKVLGFGVGRERIPAVLAARGCKVMATDFSAAGEWAAQSIADVLRPRDGDTDPALAHLDICDAELFRRHVQFRDVDMTQIPEDLRDYDCLWSCGSLEHIGGLSHGLDFIERSLACLKPGGIAVHTTEFNLSSNESTLDTPSMSFYRRADIEALAARLQAQGHTLTLNFTRGTGPIDNHVDKPPFDYELTMNALVAGYLITSIGLIIRKG